MEMKIEKIEIKETDNGAYKVWNHDPILAETINKMISEIEKLDQIFECFASYSVFNDKVQTRQDKLITELKNWIEVHKEITGGQHIHFENIENRLLELEDLIDPMQALGKVTLKAIRESYCEQNPNKIERDQFPKEGSFEWAVTRIRLGNHVRRKDWDWKCCISEGGGATLLTDVEDILACDWVIEKNYR